VQERSSVPTRSTKQKSVTWWQGIWQRLTLPAWWWPWWVLLGLAVMALMALAFFAGWLAGVGSVVPALRQLHQDIAAVQARRPLVVHPLPLWSGALGFAVGAWVAWRVASWRRPASNLQDPSSVPDATPLPKASRRSLRLGIVLLALGVAVITQWPQLVHGWVLLRHVVMRTG
jgi:hypothetical protein